MSTGSSGNSGSGGESQSGSSGSSPSGGNGSSGGATPGSGGVARPSVGGPLSPASRRAIGNRQRSGGEPGRNVYRQRSEQQEQRGPGASAGPKPNRLTPRQERTDQALAAGSKALRASGGSSGGAGLGSGAGAGKPSIAGAGKRAGAAGPGTSLPGKRRAGGSEGAAPDKDASPFSGALRAKGARGSKEDGSASVKDDVKRTASGVKQGAEIGAKVGGGAPGAVVGGALGGAAALAGSKRGRIILILATFGPSIGVIAMAMVVVMVIASFANSIFGNEVALTNVSSAAAVEDGLDEAYISDAMDIAERYDLPWEIIAAIPYTLGTDPLAPSADYSDAEEEDAKKNNDPIGPYGVIWNDSRSFLSENRDVNDIAFDQLLDPEQSGVWIASGISSRLSAANDQDLNLDMGVVSADDPDDPDRLVLDIGEDEDDKSKAEEARDGFVAALEKLPIEDAADNAPKIFDTALTWHLGGADECETGASASSAPSSVDGIPQVALDAYVASASKTGVPWYYIAAIGFIESGHGSFGGASIDADGNIRPKILGPVLNGTGGFAAIRDTDNGRLDGDRTWDRAVGPMQFIPGTWNAYGGDGNLDGVIDPQNIWDSALTTGKYLKANGAPADMHNAILHYNHSEDYYNAVEAKAQEYKQAEDAGALVDNSSGPTAAGTLRTATVEFTFDTPRPKIGSTLNALSGSADVLFIQGAGGVSVDSIMGGGWSVTQNRSNPATADSAIAVRDSVGSVVSSGGELLATAASSGGAELPNRFIAWAGVKLAESGRVVRLASVHFPDGPFAYKQAQAARNFTTWVNTSRAPLIAGGDWGHYLRRDRYRIKSRTHNASGSRGNDGFLIDPVLRVRRIVSASAPDAVRDALSGSFDTSRLANTPVTVVPNDPFGGVVNGNPGGNQTGSGTGLVASAWTMPMKEGTWTPSAHFGEHGPHWTAYAVGHSGEDFAAPTGTPVYAINAGTVTVSPSTSYGSNFLSIDHGYVDGKKVVSRYAHMSKRFVETGDTVTAGEMIGEVGAEGNVTGPHLHLEIIVGDPLPNGDPNFVDPLDFLTTAGSPTGGVASCGLDAVAPYTGSTSADGAWGGYQNGRIPLSALQELSWSPGAYLRPDAAQALEALNKAFQARFGKTIGNPVGGYRSYEGQVACQREKGSLCATPGTSNHGWGLAVDLSNGINSFGTPEFEWMKQHAGEYGWLHPDWAEPSGSKPEPWHWQYGVTD